MIGDTYPGDTYLGDTVSRHGRMEGAVAVVSRQVITSAANPLLKKVRRALVQGTLTDDGYAVAESFHLLEEALRSDLDVPVVLAAASVRKEVERHVGRLQGVRLTIVGDALLEKTATTRSSQGVIALVRPPVWDLDAVFRGRSLVVALDGVQDPGNAGTIVRSTEAFGGTGVVFLPGSASPFNSKLLRASAGSMFRVPFVHGVDADLVQAAFRQRKVQVLAASPRARLRAARCDLTRPTVLLIGSEGRGVSEVFERQARGVRIPTTGVESLNAATAAGVLLYEAARRRAEHGLRGTKQK